MRTLAQWITSTLTVAMDLLGQSLSATQNGYRYGIDPNDVMMKYDSESGIFRSFNAANIDMRANIVQRGTDSVVLVNYTPAVKRECRIYTRS